MNKPKCRYIYNPVQIAECGGPCEQGPEHCDCGELWVIEPGAPTDEELILTYAFAVAEAVNPMCKPLKPEDYKYAQLAGLRAILARWGADQELEACCEWLRSSLPGYDKHYADCLHTARRPKPPSLKHELREIIECLVEGDCVNDEDAVTLRRALEALPDV